MTKQLVVRVLRKTVDLSIFFICATYINTKEMSIYFIEFYKFLINQAQQMTGHWVKEGESLLWLV